METVFVCTFYHPACAVVTPPMRHGSASAAASSPVQAAASRPFQRLHCRPLGKQPGPNMKTTASLTKRTWYLCAQATAVDANVVANLTLLSGENLSRAASQRLRRVALLYDRTAERLRAHLMTPPSSRSSGSSSSSSSACSPTSDGANASADSAPAAAPQPPAAALAPSVAQTPLATPPCLQDIRLGAPAAPPWTPSPH